MSLVLILTLLVAGQALLPHAQALWGRVAQSEQSQSNLLADLQPSLDQRVEQLRRETLQALSSAKSETAAQIAARKRVLVKREGALVPLATKPVPIQAIILNDTDALVDHYAVQAELAFVKAELGSLQKIEENRRLETRVSEILSRQASAREAHKRLAQDVAVNAANLDDERRNLHNLQTELANYRTANPVEAMLCDKAQFCSQTLQSLSNRQRFQKAKVDKVQAYQTLDRILSESDAQIANLRASMLPVETALEQALQLPDPKMLLEQAQGQGRHWMDQVKSLLKTAMLIWLGLLLMPWLIKAVAYFGLAPLAEKLPPIRLLDAEDGDLSVAGRVVTQVAQGSISKVSLAIDLRADQEILVHPDYLQSVGNAGAKDTKWLLNWSYPLSSLAAGLTMLTRVRPAGQAVVVSSRKDPFSEVAAIELAQGVAVVLHPRALVGVVQPIDQPLQITSHWRLFSLHAWLTWQMRFLVFHGPCTLIVQGRRGVRAEPADSGRSISQSATIGFSASLGYAVRRSETFMAFARGDASLFNDSLQGGRGVYLYQEMPDDSLRKGLLEKSIGGGLDAVRHMLGI